MPAVIALNSGSAAPRLPGASPPPTLVASLASPSAGLEELRAASAAHAPHSGGGCVEVRRGAGGVSFTWVCGPQAPVREYVILSVEDDDVGLYVPATISASVNALSGGPRGLANLSFSAAVRAAGTPP